MICLGGYHSSVHPDESDSIRLIQRAIDEGITFLDNAWDYHNGGAEERMGKAISQGSRRDKVFLMTKCCGRTAKDAQSHLEDSLRRLRTDHLDLWQFHEIVYDNDPDWIFAKGGAIEYALKAKEQGKIRFLGFTGHKDPSIHLKMLDKPYPWATVQMPLNVMDSQYRSFQHKVLPVLNERGIGPIGMKSLGGTGKIVSEGVVSIEEALRYVFSLPIATLVSGIDSEKVLEQNLRDRARVQADDRRREGRRREEGAAHTPATDDSSCSRARRSSTAPTIASSMGLRPISANGRHVDETVVLAVSMDRPASSETAGVRLSLDPSSRLPIPSDRCGTTAKTE